MTFNHVRYLFWTFFRSWKSLDNRFICSFLHKCRISILIILNCGSVSWRGTCTERSFYCDPSTFPRQVWIRKQTFSSAWVKHHWWTDFLLPAETFWKCCYNVPHFIQIEPWASPMAPVGKCTWFMIKMERKMPVFFFFFKSLLHPQKRF